MTFRNILRVGICAFPLAWGAAVFAQPGARLVDTAPAGDHSLALYSAAVTDIIANRVNVVAELTALWGHGQGVVGDDIAASLQYASPDLLYRVGQAASFEEVLQAMRVDASGKSEFIALPQQLGDAGQDWAYTAVEPCRVVDTRFQTGPVTGPIAGGDARKFYTYGAVSAQNGGAGQGNPDTCSAPRGEPRGVHLNVTVVPQAGNGNVRVYPANIATPNASLVNYQAGKNVANAATVKTAYLAGQEIEVFASSVAHVIIDVMGYYYEAPAPIGVEYAGGNQDVALTSSYAVVRSVTVTAPSAGHVIVNASGYFYGTSSTAVADVGRCSITPTTGLDGDYVIYFNDGRATGLEVGVPMAGTRGFAVPAGDSTFNLVCDEFSGNVRVSDTNLTATFTPHRY